MRGRDLGHVTTWDFTIFLLKRGYLIVKSMVFFDLRISRSYITAHKPAELALVFQNQYPESSDVTNSDVVETRRAECSFLPALLVKSDLSSITSKTPDLVAISACPADKFKVKAVPKFKHAIRLDHIFSLQSFQSI